MGGQTRPFPTAAQICIVNSEIFNYVTALVLGCSINVIT